VTRLSGVTPSGHMHIGNYLGAVRRWAAEGAAGDLYFVSDLHAMTTAYQPARLRALTREQLAVLLAAGIPAESVFVQSDIAGDLGALSWVLQCTCGLGEAYRMTQFKSKSTSEGTGGSGVRLGLLSYPVLMAADILLPGVDEVPVGEDQLQHVELTRTLARRFNNAYGEVFVVPKAVTPPVAARVRDLAEPSRKMSKSTGDVAGVVYLLDPPDLVRRKVRRAKTDTLGRVEYRPDHQPGVANLLEILGACIGCPPRDAASGLTSYAELKETVAEAIVEQLRALRARVVELLADPGELDRIRAAGAANAANRGAHRLHSALRLAGIGP
jgi:tryptophanyl-tRNA synthetase